MSPCALHGSLHACGCVVFILAFITPQVRGFKDYLLFDDTALDHYMHVVDCLRNPNLDLYLVLILLTGAEVEQVSVLRAACSTATSIPYVPPP